MKQRLGIAAALLPDPELLILDEPTNGLDPAGIVEMRGLIRSLAGDGITVLVSSHLISEIEQICDHVVMIRAGRLVHQGSVAELQAAQHPDFLVAAEHDADAATLATLLEAAGCTVTARPGEARALVAAPGLSAADLNRIAAGKGITLRQLSERTRSLERAFFALTSTDDSGLRPAGQDARRRQLPAARAVLRGTGRVRGGRDRGARKARADHGVVHRYWSRRPVPGTR
jgi:ABC-2 type transport system ATP-binding protein